jgi:hypothetical protein
MGDNEDFDIIAERCGLPLDVCIALFEAGWTFHEAMGEPGSCWVSPISNLENNGG